jgi:hypothetical protein
VAKSIFLSVPHYGDLAPEALTSLVLPTREERLKIQPTSASILPHNFNLAWTLALNQREKLGLTHFSMHHADISAEAGWLDTLLEELEKYQADVVSVAVAIKDGRGLTSTALQDRCTGKIRRLTMRELHQMPPTFDAGDAERVLGSRGHDLLVNSGLWVCRFDTRWPEQFPGFEFRTRIKRLIDGTFVPEVESEDWLFSAWAARHGLKVMGTRKVKVGHYGRSVFGNAEPWGSLEHDVP